MQTLKYGKPFTVEYDSAKSQTLPLYLDKSEGNTITFEVVADAILLAVTGMTDEIWKQLNDSLYLFASAGSSSQVRAITALTKVDGAPDTYFITVSEPFTCTATDYPLLVVDPTDWQPSFTVIAKSAVSVDAAADIITANTQWTAYATGVQEPVVLHGESYSITNGLTANITT